MKKIELFDIVNTIIMLIILVLVGAPILYILSVSLSSNEAIARGIVTFFPRDINLSAYKEILSTPKIPRAYLNSIIYTALSSAISMLLVTLTAYPLSRRELKGKKEYCF